MLRYDIILQADLFKNITHVFFEREAPGKREGR